MAQFGGNMEKSISKHKFAFTLAEVLITLGIIGVVAAITIPTLLANHKKKEASARLKKFSSSMQQALIFAQNEFGTPAYEWIDIRDYQDEDGNIDQQQSYDLSYAYWNKYLAPYMNCLKVEKGVYNEEDNTKSSGTKIYFTDGSTVTLHFGNCIDLIFDVNGNRLPNEDGRDRFVFFIATGKSYAKAKEEELYKNQSFAAAYLPLYDTREKAFNACKTKAYYCSALLQYDDWEFKDDYPYRL